MLPDPRRAASSDEPDPDRRPRIGLRLGLAVLLAATGLLVVVFAASHHAMHRSPARPATSGRRVLHGFGEIGVAVNAAGGKTHNVCMLAAASTEQQERGLMTVRDRTLGDHDGMLFLFTADTRVPFWMKDTPMPLSIAYLDRDGRLVSTADMEPCGPVPTGVRAQRAYDARCAKASQAYAPAAPYRFAVEVPRGRLASIGLRGDARLQVTGACQPLRR